MAQVTVNTNVVLNTTAGSTDIVVKNRELYIKGALFLRFDDVQASSVFKKVAVASETLGVVTFTVASATPAYNTDYSLSITIQNPTAQGATPNPITSVIKITTPATGTLTPTTVDAQFIARINATLGTYVLATGTTTLIVTALAGYPVVNGGWVINPDSSTVVQTTQGIAKFGLAAGLNLLGVPSALTTGAAYTMYSVINATNIGQNNTMRVNQVTPKILWLNEAMTNYASFITAMDIAILDATYIQGTVAVGQ